MEKKVMKNLASFGLLVLLVSLVSAYGVGSRFDSTENPVRLYPGQQQDMNLELQNAIPSDGNITFKAEIVDSANGMVKFAYEDNVYFVENGARVQVPLVVSVPSDAPAGQNYTARVSFRQVSTGEQTGMISLSGGMDYTFKIVVVGSKDQNSFYTAPQQASSSPMSNTLLYVLIGLVVVIILVVVLSKKRK